MPTAAGPSSSRSRRTRDLCHQARRGRPVRLGRVFARPRTRRPTRSARCSAVSPADRRRRIPRIRRRGREVSASPAIAFPRRGCLGFLAIRAWAGASRLKLPRGLIVSRSFAASPASWVQACARRGGRRATTTSRYGATPPCERSCRRAVVFEDSAALAGLAGRGLLERVDREQPAGHAGLACDRILLAVTARPRASARGLPRRRSLPPAQLETLHGLRTPSRAWSAW